MEISHNRPRKQLLLALMVVATVVVLLVGRGSHFVSTASKNEIVNATSTIHRSLEVISNVIDPPILMEYQYIGIISGSSEKEEHNEGFGHSLALSGDGEWLVIRSGSYNSTLGRKVGNTEIWRRVNTTFWQLDATLPVAAPGTDSIAINENGRVLVMHTKIQGTYDYTLDVWVRTNKTPANSTWIQFEFPLDFLDEYRTPACKLNIQSSPFSLSEDGNILAVGPGEKTSCTVFFEIDLLYHWNAPVQNTTSVTNETNTPFTLLGNIIDPKTPTDPLDKFWCSTTGSISADGTTFVGGSECLGDYGKVFAYEYDNSTKSWNIIGEWHGNSTLGVLGSSATLSGDGSTVGIQVESGGEYSDLRRWGLFRREATTPESSIATSKSFNINITTMPWSFVGSETWMETDPWARDGSKFLSSPLWLSQDGSMAYVTRIFRGFREVWYYMTRYQLNESNNTLIAEDWNLPSFYHSAPCGTGIRALSGDGKLAIYSRIYSDVVCLLQSTDSHW